MRGVSWKERGALRRSLCYRREARTVRTIAIKERTNQWISQKIEMIDEEVR